MPSDIKKAAMALVISCISTLIAVYFDGLRHESIGYNDPFTIGINIVWILIIAWLIFDLFNGKDIKLTIVLVGTIMTASLIYDFIEYDFDIAQAFYAVELLMFIFAYILVSTEQSKAWYSIKNL